MTDERGEPEYLQAPPEFLEKIDYLLTHPEVFVKGERARKRLLTLDEVVEKLREDDPEFARLQDEYGDAAEDAVLESSDEEQFPRSWIFWAVIGALGLGLVIRWWLKKR